MQRANLTAIWLLTSLTLWAADPIVMPGMAGHWHGDARIIVIWCQQTNLHVRLDIRADGTVNGNIGDAMLTRGQLRRSRGWLGRKLHVKTDYIITGGLTGPIVAAEGISRSGVKMPLNFRGGSFVGGIHTTGTKFGTKERGILSARLTLARPPRP